MEDERSEPGATAGIVARAAPAGSTLSDEEVVARVLAGDGPLFELIMRRHNQRLYRIARGILRDDKEAEDVLQQGYVEAYAHLAEYGGRAVFAAWLTRIVVNEALGRLRQRRWLTLVADDVGWQPMVEQSLVRPSRKGPEEQAFDGEVAHMLEQGIDALPEALRTVFVLRVIEGMSTAEAAACLGISEENVKVRLHRARAALQKDLYQRACAGAPEAFRFLGERCDRVVAGVLERLGLRR